MNDNDFSVKDMDSVLDNDMVEIEEDPEWLEEQNDEEKVFEEILENILLDTEYVDVNFTSPFSDSGIMTNNKGLVVEVQELTNEKGKTLKGPFEFQITIIKSK